MFSCIWAISLFAAAAVSAADICTYTSRNCIGDWGCCTNIPANTCCYWGWGTPYGWSTKFSSMPDPTPPAVYWLGRTYGDQCTTSTSGGASSGGSVCLSVFNAPNYLNAQSAAWFNTAGKQSADAGAVSAGTPCRTPDKLGFTKDGVEHEVKVPEGQFDTMFKLLKEEKYDVLLAFSQ